MMQLLHVFSSNAAPFEPSQTYTPFAVYALLEHGGNFTEAAKSLARQGYGDQTQPRSGPSDSISALLDFLRGHNPVLYDARGRFVLADGQRIPQSMLWSLPGALEAVARTPEYLACADKSGFVRPPTHINLAKSMLAATGQRLMPELKLETFEDCPHSNYMVRRDILAFLIRPRSSSSTTGLNQSLATWAVEVTGGRWLRFGSHPIFGRQDVGGPRITAAPAYFHHEIRVLRENFTSPTESGKFLVGHKLIDGRSKPIRVEGRQIRVWEVHPDLISEACGTPAEDESDG